MNSHGKRGRLSTMLMAVAVALALVALPGVAAAHHGHDQMADAGTIGAFDPTTGALVIDLTEGGSVSGLVVDRTHIRCGEDNGQHRGRHGLRHHLRGRGLEPNEDNYQNGDDPPGHDGTPPGRSEDPGQGAEHSARCTTDDLAVGATVKFAELVLIDGKAIYREIGLAPEAGAPPSS